MKMRRAMQVGAATVLLGLAAGCGSPGSTASTTPGSTAATRPSAVSVDAEVVFRDFIAAINAGDATRAASLVAMDATFNGIGDSPIELVRSLQCEAEIVSAEDSGASLLVELRFTGTAEWGAECNVMAPGESDPFVITVEDGKIVELRHQ